MTFRLSKNVGVCALMALVSLTMFSYANLSLTKVSRAAEPSARLAKTGAYNPQDPSVDVFEGIAAGKVQVKMVVKDSTEARLLVTNNTQQPLNLRLPAAFAGVHVLAQLGGGAGGATGGSQGVGGGGAGGAGGGGAGFFNIAPERVTEIKIPCVCLEHGKPDPRPQLTYEIRPIESVSVHPEVAEVIKLLGEGKLPQRVAQAAAWHYNNNMSWEELAAKQIKRLSGESYPYFHPQEMQAAVAVGNMIEKQLKEGPIVEGQSLSKLGAKTEEK